jgi:recombination protein U
MIDLTNSLYARKGLAVIQKVPTPITPIAVDNRARTITQAYFEKKSTVDFIGVADGLAIAFDAKETRQQSFPLKNIHPHQIEFMENFRAQGGAAFLIVNFALKNETFLLPSSELAIFYKQSLAGGRKSIPLSAFTLRVTGAEGFPIHYLPAIRAYLAQNPAQNPKNS